MGLGKKRPLLCASIRLMLGRSMQAIYRRRTKLRESRRR